LLAFLLDKPQGDVQVLSLGCAAGSILRVMHAVLGERLVAVGVDLDPVVLELGRRWFHMPENGPRFQAIGDLDARVYVERVEPQRTFDLICVDAYRNQIYVPAHLASVEFFAATRRRLAPGGVLALNVGDLSLDGPVLSAVAGTLAHVFPTVESFRVAGSRNFLVLAHDRKPGLLARSLARSKRPLGFPPALWQAGLVPEASKRWSALPAGQLLTDARSSLGRLHERLYNRLTPRVGP